jgi:hypothetical protein
MIEPTDIPYMDQQATTAFAGVSVSAPRLFPHIAPPPLPSWRLVPAVSKGSVCSETESALSQHTRTRTE